VHLAVKGKQRVPVVRMFAHEQRQRQALLQDRDNKGLVPLHHAAYGKAPGEVTKYLVRQCPAALYKKDVNGRLPLHWVAAIGTLGEVRILAHAWEQALREKEQGKGMLPLHVAVRWGAPVQVVLWLVRKWSPALQKRDCDGLLPVHWAVAGYRPQWAAHSKHLEIVQFLTIKYPQALVQEDRLGRLLGGPVGVDPVPCREVSSGLDEQGQGRVPSAALGGPQPSPGGGSASRGGNAPARHEEDYGFRLRQSHRRRRALSRRGSVA
jgi:Ankyrin repeats (3 copies)